MEARWAGHHPDGRRAGRGAENVVDILSWESMPTANRRAPTGIANLSTLTSEERRSESAAIPRRGVISHFERRHRTAIPVSFILYSNETGCKPNPSSRSCRFGISLDSRHS